MSASRLTPQKQAEYIAGLQQLELDIKQCRLDRHRRALQAARAAAAVLRKRFPITRVRAFGSVLNPESFHLHSDIDLAVEGIDPMQLLKAWSAASAVAPEFDFDLVTQEECRPVVWAAVEKEGIDL